MLEKPLYLKPIFSWQNIAKEKLITILTQTNSLRPHIIFLRQSHKGDRHKGTTILLADDGAMHIDQCLNNTKQNDQFKFSKRSMHIGKKKF